MRWPYDLPIDAVERGLRCLIRKTETRFVPEPGQRGSDFFGDDARGQPERIPGHELRAANLSRSAHFDRKTVVAVVQVDDVSALDHARCDGQVQVRVERDGARALKQGDLLTFGIKKRISYWICGACGGDGRYKSSGQGRFACLSCCDHGDYACNIPGMLGQEVERLVSFDDTMILDIDGEWPALPDLREDSRAEDAQDIRSWWTRAMSGTR